MEKKKQGKLCFPAGSGEWTVGRYRRVEEAEGAVEKVLLLSWRVLKYIGTEYSQSTRGYTVL